MPVEKTGVSLNIVVIGGGIAGLAAAYSLQRAGHEVLVIDKGNENSQDKSNVGLQCPPNMTRLLYRWGLKPLLNKYAQKCKWMAFSSGGTGDMMGTMDLGEAFLKEIMADFLLIEARDLQRMVRKIAVEVGVRIFYRTEVISVNTSPDLASVSLYNGKTLTADFIVAADGYDSILRPVVADVGEEELLNVERPPTLELTWLIPLNLINQHEDLRPIVEMTQNEYWLLWFGSAYAMHASLSGKNLTVTMTCFYERKLQPGDEKWEKRTLEYHGIDLSKFEPRLKKLLCLLPTVNTRVFLNRSLPEDFVCEDSKIVLVGDAAHPLIPAGNHCTSLSFEDAETLGRLFSRIQNTSHISHLLNAYQDIRHSRCAWVFEYDKGFHDMVKVVDGPEQVARDAIFRQTMMHGDWDHMDETTFRAVWGTELTIFAHDATEQVDDWWTHWGALLSRQENRLSRTGNSLDALTQKMRRVSISSRLP